MTKQEQIEEMAQIICGRSKDDICIIDNTSCDSSCRWARDAEAIYNAGYRKIDDKCAVITKDDLNLYKKQSVKEFATLVKRECTFTNNHGLDLIRVVDFDVLLREYEVEE